MLRNSFVYLFFYSDDIYVSIYTETIGSVQQHDIFMIQKRLMLLSEQERKEDEFL